MTIVHFAISPGDTYMLRQTPGGDGRWDDVQFLPDPGAKRPDWLVVYDHPPRGLVTSLPKHRRIVFLSEPRSIKRYDSAFVDQFGVVVAQTPPEDFDGERISSYSAVPWHYGIDFSHPARRDDGMSFDAIAAAPGDVERRGLISAICSTKALNRNQVRRLRFLNRLKTALGGDLEVYGRGFRPLGDKAEGLNGFRYHMVLENNLDPRGWTEKFADPVLAGVYPIVAGDPVLAENFDPLGFASIDIRKPDSAVEDVRRILADDPASRADVRAAMEENKRRLMNTHQLFPLMSRIIEALPESTNEEIAPEAIKPPRKHPLRHFIRPFRPLRKPANQLAIALMERG